MLLLHEFLSQTVGVTTTLPRRVPSCLPSGHAGPHEWNYWNRALYHNKQKTEFPDLPSLNDLTRGQKVGLLVTTNGQLHLFLDGQHCKEIATGLPVDTPLWGTADVYHSCTKIKSEILRGESGGVDCVVWVSMKQSLLHIKIRLGYFSFSHFAELMFLFHNYLSAGTQ